MIVLALSVVTLVTFDIVPPVEGQDDGKCLSTLEDFKEAYFRGDYYRSDPGEWGYDAFYRDGSYMRIGLTMGFYRLTYN